MAAHDLEEILAGIDRYLHRLGGSGPNWKQRCSIGRGVHAVLPPYYSVFCRAGGIKQDKQPSEERPTDTKTAEYKPVCPHDPQQDISLASNANIQVFI
jgi:hypothetical protein